MRSTTISLSYTRKDNPPDADIVYMTVGLGMTRASNTFRFTLTTLSLDFTEVRLTLTLFNNNGLRFIRIVMVNYERVRD